MIIHDEIYNVRDRCLDMKSVIISYKWWESFIFLEFLLSLTVGVQRIDE